MDKTFGSEGEIIRKIEPTEKFRKIKKMKSLWRLILGKKKRNMKDRIVRKDSVWAFGRVLLYRKEGVVKIIEELRKAIESTSDISVEALMKKVILIAEEYDLPATQINVFRYAIKKYRRKHSAVEKYSNLYPDDGDLFKACFGRRPRGKVEVLKGPMTLFFRCFNVADYLLIADFLNSKGDESKMKQESIDLFLGSSGVATPRLKIKELYGTITAENVAGNSSVSSKEVSDCVRTHEDLHQYNDLYIPPEWTLCLPTIISGILSENISPEEVVERLIYNFVKFQRRAGGFDSLPRNEIIAKYGAGMDAGAILEDLKDDKLYDYSRDCEKMMEKILIETRRWLRMNFKEVIYRIKNGKTILVSQKPIKIEKSKILVWINWVFRDEYYMDLQNWLCAILLFEKKGYSRDEILCWLYSEPINSWVNTARRVETKEG